VPLYEYRCKDCGHQFEKIQSFSAPDEKECPVCQGPLERLISAPAIQFKGSGWYATDYAAKPKPGSMKASADGDGKSGDNKSSDTKSGSSDAKSGDKPAKAASDSSSSSSSSASTPSTSKSD
jgi:putative FmdB family regulatory protein